MNSRGYSMLILLPVLIVVMLSTPLIQLPLNDVSLNSTAVLSDARQQLLVYAATYLEYYPPAGAGPGHLPCPDTDRSADVYQVQWGLNGDGPNPPCGSGAIAIGKLPRHISHLKHRYAFHLEDKHAIGYAVDTQFINNPTNRAVNPSTVGSMQLQGNGALAAVLFLAKEDSSIWHRASVPAWLQHAFQGGSSKEKLFQSVESTAVLTSSDLLEVVNLSVVAWLQQRFSSAGVVQSCSLPTRVRLYLSLLDDAHTIECEGAASDIELANQFIADSRLEGVFLKRHWFYRNDWWQFVSTSIEESCDESSDSCKVLVAPKSDHSGIELKVINS